MYTKLLNEGTPLEIYIVARYAQQCMKPFISSNELFDKLEGEVAAECPDCPYFDQSYDDDDAPLELLLKYGIELTPLQTEETSRIKKYKSYLRSDTNISIAPMRSLIEAYNWFKPHNGKLMCCMTKVDGTDTKSLVNTSTHELLVTSSRGRRAKKLFDYTDAVQQKLGSTLRLYKSGKVPQIMPVWMEAYVDEEGIAEHNRRHPNNTYVNGRSSGGILTNGIDDDLIDHLHLVAFRATDGNNTLSNTLDNLEFSGLETPPHHVVRFEDKGFEEFCSWISEIQKDLNSRADAIHMPYDGVVVQLNEWAQFNAQPSTSMYSLGNIALKCGENAPKIYDAVVRDISLVFEGRSKEKLTCKLFLEPFTVEDGKTISKITGYNLGQIVSRGINRGSKIQVLYQSGTTPILYNGGVIPCPN